MNQGMYRLLFNTAKGVWVVVGEIAKTRQKAACCSLSQSPPVSLKAIVSPLRCALLLAFGHLLFSAPLLADIVADANVPANQQATVLSTANGLPQVNIQTPTAGGVSRNQFSQFDVDAQGAIINNSRVNISTQLGGFVSANPYLATGSATVILNEVNSTNPSLLNGHMEIAGQRADFIIANPAGISCSGCGFINANQTVLTTGDVIFNGNTIDAYRVNDGTINIDGDGLDATDSHFTHLISRSVEINAGIWAQDLQITTGTNEVAASGASVNEISAGADQPSFAIDVSALGGMYANVIRLVGTEDGVGMRNAGEIGAGVGGFTLSADGQLVNKHVISSDAHLSIEADSIDNTDGAIHTNQALSLTVANTLDNTRGLVSSANDNVTLQDTDLANNNLLITNTDGTMIANHMLTIDSHSLSGDGNLYSEGDIDIQLASTYTHTGELIANGTAKLHTTGNIDHQSTMAAGQLLDLQAATIDTQAGSTFDATSLKLNATDSNTFNNRSVINGTNVDIDTITLNNLGTGRIYGDVITLAADTINNHAEDGQAPVIAARNELDIGVGSLSNQGGALIYSDGDLSIGGAITAGQATGTATLITNTNATIEAAGSLDITANRLDNLSPDSYILGSMVTSEDIERLQRGILDNGTLNKLGSIHDINGTTVRFDYDNHLSERQARIPAGVFDDYYHYQVTRTTSTPTITRDLNAVAKLISGGSLTLTLDTLNNPYSDITAGGNLNAQVNNINNAEVTGTETVSESGTITGFYSSDNYSAESYSSSSSAGTVNLAASVYRGNTDETSGFAIESNASAQFTEITNTTGAVRSSHGSATVTNNSLFIQNSAPTATYLIETDPLFTNSQLWLSSDYVTQQVAQSPEFTNKRLGDGFYEQRLVREQIVALTGRRFLESYSDDETQYRDLLDSGIAFAQTYNLRPGITLSEAQMANLTTDLVWLEAQDVQLADGSTQQVLVPKLYAVVQPNDLLPSGALLSGDSIDIQGDELVNSGQLIARARIDIDVGNVSDTGGRLQAAAASITATTDVTLAGSDWRLEDDLSIDAGRDVTIRSLSDTVTDQNGNASSRTTTAGRRATITVGTGNNASTLEILAGRNASLTGATISNTGTGDTRVEADNDLTLDTLTEERSVTDAYGTESISSEVTSQVSGQGNVIVRAGNDFTSRGGDITAAQALTLEGDNIRLTTAESRLDSNFLGGNSQANDLTHDGTNLQAGTDLSLTALNDLEATGANASAGNDLALNAGGDTTIEVAQDESYRYSFREQKKSWGRKKTELKESFTTTNVGGEFSAGNTKIAPAFSAYPPSMGGNLTINSTINPDDSVTADATNGDVTIIGGDLTAENQVAIAGNSVTIADKKEVTLTREETFKRGFGGWSRKSTGQINRDELIQSSEVVANQRDLDLISASDIAIVGSNITSGEDINLTAVDDIIITADQALSQAQTWSKETKFLSGLSSLYEMEEKVSGSTTSTVVASEVNAGGNVTITSGRARVVGSDITVGNDLSVTTDIGDIIVESAQSHAESFSNETKVKIGFSDVVDQLVDVEALADSLSDGQAKLSIAKATYDKVDTQTTETNHRASQLIANNDVNLDSVGDIAITGSDIIADADNNQQGDASLLAGGDVTIKETADISDTQVDEVHGQGEVSIVVQHQAVEVVKAAEAVKAAKDQVKQANEDYRKYQKDLALLKNQRDQLQTDYDNKVPGLLYDDIVELTSLIDEVESDKDWYQAGIVLAAANLVSKTTLLTKQTKAGAESIGSGSLGFNAGVQIDLDASKTETKSHSEVSRGSILAGNNISIQTGNNSDITQTATQITGSHLQANDTLTINTGELTVEASKDDNSLDTNTEQASIRIAQTLYGTGAGGPTISADYSRSQAENTNTTYNNSTLNADNITLSSTGDTTIKGANIKADDTLTLNVGEDLHVQSQQNRYSANNKSAGISAGFSLGKGGTESTATAPALPAHPPSLGGNSKTLSGAAQNIGQHNGEVSSVSGGLNASSGRTRTKETVLTDLTGETVNITVGDNAALIGATIAAKDENGNNNGQLTLTTDSFDFADLSNTHYSSQKSAGVSTSVGIPSSDPTQNNAKDAKGEDDLKLNTSNIAYSNNSSYSKNKQLATLGQGTITIADDQATGEDSTERLNRDTENTTKDLYSIDRQQGNIDLTIDTRLLTEDGRKQIVQDYIDSTAWHYEGRDARNSNLPQTLEKAHEEGWILLETDKAIYHDNGTGEKELKFIHPDGREAVFDGDTLQIITDSIYAGTYNYINPKEGASYLHPQNILHGVVDIIPFCIGGNDREGKGVSCFTKK